MYFNFSHWMQVLIVVEQVIDLWSKKNVLKWLKKMSLIISTSFKCFKLTSIIMNNGYFSKKWEHVNFENSWPNTPFWNYFNFEQNYMYYMFSIVGFVLQIGHLISINFTKTNEKIWNYKKNRGKNRNFTLFKKCIDFV